MSVQISTSILNCDASNLERELERVSLADWIHVDVMDNHFVPNLTWGLPIVEACLKATNLPIDAHLMIENPDRWALEYAQAGCASVTFHAEASLSPISLARQIRKRGARAAIAIRPSTPIDGFLDFLSEFDMVLVMTVEPGFGGQRFMRPTMTKVQKIREVIEAQELNVDIQVDGGISRDTIAIAARAGANNFVAGSAIYRSENPNTEIKLLKQLASEAKNVA